MPFKTGPGRGVPPGQPRRTRLLWWSTTSPINIAHLERKRQAAEFDVPVDDLPVGRSAKRRNQVPGPSPDAFLESQRKAARIQQEPSVPFDEEPISGNTVIPSAHQEEFGARAVSEEELLGLLRGGRRHCPSGYASRGSHAGGTGSGKESAPKTPGLLRKWWPRRLRKTPRRLSRSITFLPSTY